MTFEEIKNVIVESINCDADEVTMTATLEGDLGADSLDAIELNMALEEAFNVTIPESELVNMKTVGDIVRILQNK